MFLGAKAFTGDISHWDVSSVKNMNMMFMGATSFKRELCGAAWVESNANKESMFEESPGSISAPKCTPQVTTATTAVSLPFPERELIARTPINTPTILGKMSSCPKCATFPKSGRVSCCAPGGAWHNSCGGAANTNVDHRWFEGTKACKRKSEADAM